MESGFIFLVEKVFQCQGVHHMNHLIRLEVNIEPSTLIL